MTIAVILLIADSERLQCRGAEVAIERSGRATRRAGKRKT